MHHLEPEIVHDFLGESASPREVRISRLSGGLESAVARVDVTNATSGTRRRTFVVKRLDAGQEHEVRAYRLLHDLNVEVTPELLGLRLKGGSVYLFIDWIPSESRWPWQDLRWPERVAEQLARLHEIAVIPPEVERREYENRLVESARETWRVFAWLSGPEFESITSRRASLRRFIEDLTEVRRTLFTEGPFPPALIHGDAHPGNAIVHASRDATVLIDWGRTRLGSPFEDVSSWLQSLGLWEPRARRRHDRLFASYLRSRGLDAITSEVRDHYWLAAGCNALAGALRYHIVAALDHPSRSAGRAEHVRLAARWMAIVRRADARWRSRREGVPDVGQA